MIKYNTIVVVLPGSIRSKKNSKRIFAKGNFKRVLPSKAYEAWEKQSRLYFRAHWPRFQPFEDDVDVCVHAYYKGRRPDLSGVLESVGDCMEGFLWRDDKQIMSWDGSRLYHDKENPRTEIIVKES